MLDVIRAYVDGEDAAQAHAIFGDETAESITEAIRAFVARHLQQQIVGCNYHHLSVGLTLELTLGDGSSCVFKALPGDADRMAGPLRVQAHLAEHGFPAPRVLAFPDACGRAAAFVIEPIDRGAAVTYDESIRDTMADGLARLVELAESLSPRPPLPDGPPPVDRLWPTPHSAFFDFAGTTATAGWIDEIASAARAQMPPAEDHVVAHCDWSLQNVALREGRLVGVFDWDSVRWVSEVLAVAGAAAFHSQDWRLGSEGRHAQFYPGPAATLAFIDRYLQARRLSWGEAQWACCRASLVYRLAYQARCGHALDPDGPNPAADRLLRFARDFGLATRA